jgi:hypothetical protein
MGDLEANTPHRQPEHADNASKKQITANNILYFVNWISYKSRVSLISMIQKVGNVKKSTQIKWGAVTLTILYLPLVRAN